MMKTCVILNGQIINIGEWDYQYTEINGEQTAQNPFPDGATIGERAMEQDADEVWVLSDDYQRLRQAAYPPYSPFDILDEILKSIIPVSGSKLEEIQNARLAVKTHYPKPE